MNMNKIPAKIDRLIKDLEQRYIKYKIDGLIKDLEQRCNNYESNITPEQEASMPMFVEKYTEIGINTDPIDRDKARAYASKLYKFLEYHDPQVLFANGPTEAWLMTVWVNHMQQNNIEIPEKAEDIVFDFDAIRKVAKGVSFVRSHLDGQMMASWVSRVKFMQFAGMELPKDFNLIEDQIEFNVIYLLNGYCIFSDRFSEVHIKDKKLHCDGGPSIEYLDGTRCWSLNGIAVPQWLAETSKEQLNLNDLLLIDDEMAQYEFLKKFNS